ncbi:MAG: hypothetical protein SynsKO_29420 [Synoicihabitans sp.]
MPDMPNFSSNSYYFTTDGTRGLVAVRLSETVDGQTQFRFEIHFSEDLSSWEKLEILSPRAGDESFSVEDLVAGNGFIAFIHTMTGPSGIRSELLYTSDEGTTWQKSIVPEGRSISSLRYGNGWFLVNELLGSGSFRSRTPISFESYDRGGAGDTIHTLFGGGLFLAADISSDPNTLFKSIDGSNWQSLGNVPLTPQATYQSTAYFGGKQYLIGAHEGLTNRPFMLALSATTDPVISRQTTASRAIVGRGFSVDIEVMNAEGSVLQWFRDDSPLDSATSPEYSLSHVASSTAGSYYAVITNSAGTLYSEPIDVTVIPAEDAGRLSNMSVNTTSGIGDKILNVGFVLSGTQSHPLTIRGIGPELETYSVVGFVEDPEMRIFRNGQEIFANDDWSGDYGASLGAFPLPSGSGDAVVRAIFSPGPHSALLGSKNGTAGIVLAELYDGDVDVTETRMTNISARVEVTESRPLIVGFVVRGNEDLPIVIRAVGPTLENYGVSGVLDNPRIQLYRNGEVIDSNDDWLEEDGRELGAFPLLAGSTDAVLSRELTPGIYTAHVTPSQPGNSSGIVLLEVYEAN